LWFSGARPPALDLVYYDRTLRARRRGLKVENNSTIRSFGDADGEGDPRVHRARLRGERVAAMATRDECLLRRPGRYGARSRPKVCSVARRSESRHPRAGSPGLSGRTQWLARAVLWAVSSACLVVAVGPLISFAPVGLAHQTTGLGLVHTALPNTEPAPVQRDRLDNGLRSGAVWIVRTWAASRTGRVGGVVLTPLARWRRQLVETPKTLVPVEPSSACSA